MKELVKNLFRDEAGASAVEYGLLVALIAVALIGAMTALKGGVNTSFDKASKNMTAS